MKSRVTATFQASSGRSYLYDDATGSIFPWTEAREAALEELIAGNRGAADAVTPDGAETLARRFVDRWAGTYHAFMRSDDLDAIPAECDIPQIVAHTAAHLVLVVTENCNLRCGYCVYGGSYTYERQHSTRRMSAEMALRAIDWFVDLIAPQRARNPRRTYGLTFYGGEPLLNVAVIQRALEHADREYPGLFRPGLTTNGTLLNEENAAVLVRHHVRLAVSIDGPEAVHDRRRRDAQGRATHARVLANLARIRAQHPEYAKTISALCVYDYDTDLEAAAAFFDERSDVPVPIFVNIAGSKNTTHWNAAKPEDLRRLGDQMGRLRRQYLQAEMEGRRVGAYCRMLAGCDIMHALLRPRPADGRPPGLPYTGACFPGRKIAVKVDGTMDLCERVNGTRPLGHLDRGGIDPARVRALMDDYRRAIMTSCGRCSFTRFCKICYAHVLAGGDIVESPADCAEIRRKALDTLRDYMSLMEANPSAHCEFETDTVMLERQWLFGG